MRIALDFDGTIVDTNRTKSEWIQRTLGIVVDPWRCDRTSCVPIIGAEAYEAMSACVYERESTLATAEVPGAPEALRRLAANAELHVVTARPKPRVEFAREWFDTRGITSLIKEFHSSHGSTKEDVCRRLEVSALVDDDRRHLEGVRLAGLRRIHLQNGRDDLAPSLGDVVVCRSWSEVVAALERDPGE